MNRIERVVDRLRQAIGDDALPVLFQLAADREEEIDVHDVLRYFRAGGTQAGLSKFLDSLSE